MIRAFLLVWCLVSTSLMAAGINTTSGNLTINLGGDGTREMTLSPQGLGIGSSVPSNNLYVAGNGIVSTNVFIGAINTTSNSILEISGSLGYNSQTVSTDKILSGNTMVLVDSSSANIGLFLPSASTARGRIYNIKKTSTANDVFVSASTSGTGSSGNIDNNSVIALNSGNTGYLNLVSSGSNWHTISNIEQSNGSESINISSSLVGWWKLDETSGNSAEDSSSSNKDGTLNSSTFAANTITGKVDTGISFTGTSNIHFPATTAIVSSPFSLTFWFMDTGSSPGAGIVGKYRTPYGSYNTQVDWHFAFAPTASNPYVQAIGNTDVATGNTSPNWPAHQANDIGILINQCWGDQVPAAFTGNGFVFIAAYASGAGAQSCKIRVYWCRATDSSMTAPVIGDSGDHNISKIITFRGCVTSGNPWDTYSGGTEANNDTSLDISALTTTVNKTILFYACVGGEDGGATSINGATPTNASLNNITELYDQGYGTNGGGQIFGWSGNMEGIGSTGTFSCTVAQANNRAWMVMALKSDTSTEVGSGNIGLLISDNAGTSYSHQTVLAPTTNTWYHMACTYDGATAKAFVNGAMVSTDAWAGTPGTEYHMRVSGNGDSLFSGKIDDIRLYNAALGANVIDALYHLGNSSL